MLEHTSSILELTLNPYTSLILVMGLLVVITVVVVLFCLKPLNKQKRTDARLSRARQKHRDQLRNTTTKS